MSEVCFNCKNATDIEKITVEDVDGRVCKKCGHEWVVGESDKSDTEEDKDLQGNCYGNYDRDVQECSALCTISDRCRVDTAKKGMAKPEVVEKKESYDDMNPLDLLVTRIEDKFEVDKGGKDGFKAFRVRRKKESKSLARINVIIKSGKIEVIVPGHAVIRLDVGLASCSQANALFTVMFSEL